MDCIKLLSELIEIPSYSKEEKNAADFLENYINVTLGFKTRRVGNNIIVEHIVDTNLPTILLNSHIDTVRPSSSWTMNPHKATIVDGKLYGLGSNDAGASLVSLLWAFNELVKKEQFYNLMFIASAEEEICGVGGLRTLAKDLPKIDLVLVGEPTKMDMAIAEKGLLVIDCVSRGKSGHAAREEGINSIYKAIEDINWFKEYKFPNVSDLLGSVKMSVTMINSGTQHNVVPDITSFVVDIRSNEYYSNSEIVDIIRKNVSCEVTPRSVDLNSSAIALSHPIVEKGLEIGMVTYGSPTMSDQTHFNVPSLKIGVGDSARSHTADEYIYLSELECGGKRYFELLDQLKLNRN